MRIHPHTHTHTQIYTHTHSHNASGEAHTLTKSYGKSIHLLKDPPAAFNPRGCVLSAYWSRSFFFCIVSMFALLSIFPCLHSFTFPLSKALFAIVMGSVCFQLKPACTPLCLSDDNLTWRSHVWISTLLTFSYLTRSDCSSMRWNMQRERDEMSCSAF